jgi:hypothetical protein
MSKTTTAWLIGLLLLSGCLTANTVLQPDASGTMTITYTIDRASTADIERRKAAGPHVTVEKAEVAGTKATLQLKFDDVRKLDTSPLFKDLHVTLDEKDGRRTLVAKVTNAKPITLPDNALATVGREVKITLALPGEVVESNGRTTVAKTVAWEMPTNDFIGVREREFRVTYKQPAAEKPAEKPATPGK